MKAAAESTPPSSAFVALEGGAYRATGLTRGPWHPEHQHAGPPIALVAREIERTAAALEFTHIARLTANLLRPIPIAELALVVQTDYVGRNAAHFSARLDAGGKEVARFTALAQLVADDLAFDLERLLVDAGEWIGDARCLEQQEIEGGVARTELVIDGGIEIRRGID